MAPTFPVSVVIRAFDRATEPIRKVNAAIAKARAPWVETLGAVKRFGDAAGLPRIQEALSGAGTALSRFGSEVVSVFARVSLVVGGATAALVALLRGFSSNADRIADASGRLGVAAETLQEWGYAAKLADVDSSTLETSLSRLSRTVDAAARGVPAAANTFAAMGVDLFDATGRARNLADLLPEIADRLDAIPDPYRRVARAQELFGRGGDRLLPMLRGGSVALERMAREARRLGVVLSSDQVQQGAELADTFDRLGSALEGLRNAFAAALTPAAIEILRRLTDWLVENRERVRQWGERIAKDLPRWIGRALDFLDRLQQALGWIRGAFARVTEVLGPVGTAVAALALILTVSLAPAIAGVVSALVTLSAAIVATPAGWVLLAIAAIVLALAGLVAIVAVVIARWDELSARWPAAARLLRFLAGVVSEFVSRYLQGLADTLEVVASGVLTVLDAFARLAEFVGLSFEPAVDKVNGKLEKTGGLLRSILGAGLGSALPFGSLLTTVGGFASGRGTEAGTPAPAAAPAFAPSSPAGPSSPARVIVDFRDVPRGTRVEPRQAPGVNLDVGLGWSNLSP